MQLPASYLLCLVLFAICVPEARARTSTAADISMPKDWFARCAGKTKIKVFTLSGRSPFSEKGVYGVRARGYTHNFIDEVVAGAFPGLAIDSIHFLESPNDNNDGIFNAIRKSQNDHGATEACDFTTGCNVCLGAAAISITPVSAIDLLLVL